MKAVSQTMLVFSELLRQRQDIACRLLEGAITKKSLANAYLFTGRTQSDKWLLTRQIAAFLNCLENTENKYFSCLTSNKTETTYCQNCQWISKDQHPQALITLAGQGDSKKIPVEKARSLGNELSKTSRYTRIVCVPNAEQNIFHPASANALLKTIEEPPEHCHFFLFATNREAVLSTIVSRSQEIPFKLESAALAPEENIDKEEYEEALALKEKLAVLRSEFIHKTRLSLSSNSKLAGSYLKAAMESQELSSRLITLGEDGLKTEDLIDCLLFADLELLRPAAGSNPAVSLYLSRLLEAAETAKQQLNHYVKGHNVLESFSYSVTELRLLHLGDFSFAKD